MGAKTCSYCGNPVDECELCGRDFKDKDDVKCLKDVEKHICGDHVIEEGSIQEKKEENPNEEDEETQCWECNEIFPNDDIETCEHCGGYFCNAHIKNHKCK